MVEAVGKKIKGYKNNNWRLKWGFVIGAFVVVLAATAINSQHSHKISTFLTNHKICSCSQVLFFLLFFSCFFQVM